MSKWTTRRLPNSIKEYGYNHAIWTDIDLAKFTFVAFVVGIVVGVVVCL
jgi:hypothetical protein